MFEGLEKELKKFEIPLCMEYEIKDLKEEGRRIKLLLEIAMETKTMMCLLESPSISQETRDSLERDLSRLIKKHHFITGREEKEVVI